MKEGVREDLRDGRPFFRPALEAPPDQVLRRLKVDSAIVGTLDLVRLGRKGSDRSAKTCSENVRKEVV